MQLLDAIGMCYFCPLFCRSLMSFYSLHCFYTVKSYNDSQAEGRLKTLHAVLEVITCI